LPDNPHAPHCWTGGWIKLQAVLIRRGGRKARPHVAEPQQLQFADAFNCGFQAKWIGRPRQLNDRGNRHGFKKSPKALIDGDCHAAFMLSDVGAMSVSVAGYNHIPDKKFGAVCSKRGWTVNLKANRYQRKLSIRDILYAP